MLGLGLQIPQIAQRGGGASDPLPTPVLTWVSDTDVATPVIDVEVGVGIMIAGDTWEWEIDDNSGFTSPALYTDTVSSGDAADGNIDVSSGPVLADGTHYMRFRVVGKTNWSNTETKTLDSPPVMTSATSFSIPETAGIGDGTLVATLTATQASTFSIGGTDAAAFEIQSGNQLHFVDPPDYGSPVDSGGNNVYDITITPTATADSEAGSAQTVAVTVTPVVDPVTATSVAGPYESAADVTQYDFTAVSLGDAANTIFAVGARGSGGAQVVSSATLHVPDVATDPTGSAISIIGQFNNGNGTVVAILRKLRGSDTSGTVRINFNTAMNRCSMRTYKLTAYNSAATATSSASPPVPNLTVAADSAVIGVGINANNTTCTLTNLTEDGADDSQIVTEFANVVYGHNNAAAGSTTFTFTFTSHTNPAAMVAAFAP